MGRAILALGLAGSDRARASAGCWQALTDVPGAKQLRSMLNVLIAPETRLGEIVLRAAKGPSGAATEVRLKAVRRAILRCGQSGLAGLSPTPRRRRRFELDFDLTGTEQR